MARATTEGTKTDGHWDVPTDREGNMASYPQGWSEPTGEMRAYTHYAGQPAVHEVYRTVEAPFVPFPPRRMRVKVTDMERGRSAARFTLEDVETGKTYPLFMVDVLAMLKDVEFEATWASVKRGQNYGITPQGDITPGIVTAHG